MRTLFARTVLLALAAAFFAACTDTGSGLTPEQRDRRAEAYIDGPLSD